MSISGIGSSDFLSYSPYVESEEVSAKQVLADQADVVQNERSLDRFIASAGTRPIVAPQIQASLSTQHLLKLVSATSRNDQKQIRAMIDSSYLDQSQLGSLVGLCTVLASRGLAKEAMLLMRKIQKIEGNSQTKGLRSVFPGHAPKHTAAAQFAIFFALLKKGDCQGVLAGSKIGKSSPECVSLALSIGLLALASQSVETSPGQLGDLYKKMAEPDNLILIPFICKKLAEEGLGDQILQLISDNRSKIASGAGGGSSAEEVQEMFLQESAKFLAQSGYMDQAKKLRDHLRTDDSKAEVTEMLCYEQIRRGVELCDLQMLVEEIQDLDLRLAILKEACVAEIRRGRKTDDIFLLVATTLKREQLGPAEKKAFLLETFKNFLNFSEKCLIADIYGKGGVEAMKRFMLLKSEAEKDDCLAFLCKKLLLDNQIGAAFEVFSLISSSHIKVNFAKRILDSFIQFSSVQDAAIVERAINDAGLSPNDLTTSIFLPRLCQEIAAGKLAEFIDRALTMEKTNEAGESRETVAQAIVQAFVLCEQDRYR